MFKLDPNVTVQIIKNALSNIDSVIDKFVQVLG